MAFALLRTSARQGSAFRGVFSAPAGAAGEGLAVRRGVSLAPQPSPTRRLPHSDTKVEPPKTLDEKVKLLNQTIKDVNRKMEKAHGVYASIRRLAGDKKPHNVYVQWLWHVCALAGILYVQDRRGSATKIEYCLLA